MKTGQVRAKTRRVITRIAEPLFESTVASKLDSRPLAIGMGDSHIGVFAEIQRLGLRPDLRLRYVRENGATAIGLMTPDSRSGAHDRLTRRLSRCGPQQSLYFLFGEIDCGYALWVIAQKRGTTVTAQLSRSLGAYERFLASHVVARSLDVGGVIAPPPPTLETYSRPGTIAEQRMEVDASIESRLALTQQYVTGLDDMCQRLGLRLLDPTPALMDPSTGRVRTHFLNSDPWDFHLHPGGYAQVLAPLL